MALEIHTVELRAKDSMSPVFKQIGANANSSARGISQSFDQASEASRRFSAASAALGVAVGASAGLLSNFARAAAEDAASQARLQQAIENTGKSYDEYSDAVDKAIKRGQSKAFSDDATREALVRLTTVTGDAGKSLDQLGLVMDFARARGISLADSATVIGKVMGGNTAILQRYGIAVEDGATATEALALIQQRSAGQADVYANSQIGHLDILKDKFGELEESIGANTGALQEFLLLLPGLSAGGTAISGLFGGLAGAGGLAGSGGAIAAFGAAIGSATIALAAFTPALAIVGYTAYTAKDNIEAVTKETNLMADALERVNAAAVANGTATGGTSTKAGIDEYAARVYGLVSQGGYNVEYTDENGKTFTLDTVFAQLALLRGEFQDTFLQAARDMNIDFTNPAAEDIQMLIANIVLLRKMQIQAAGYAMGNQNAIGITATPTTIARINSTNVIPRGTGPGGQDIGYNALQRIDLAGPGGQPTGNSPFSAGSSSQPVTGMAIGGAASKDMSGFRSGPADSATYSADAVAAQAAATRAAIIEEAGAYGVLFDGVTKASDATAVFNAVQAGLGSEMNVYQAQASEWTSELNAQESAYNILQDRQSKGIALTKEQTDFLNNYTHAQEVGTAAVEDATVSAGIAAQNMLLNKETMDIWKTSTGELTDTILLLIETLGGVPDSVRTQITLDGADEFERQLNAAINHLNNADGQTAHFYIDTKQTGISVGNPNGPSINAGEYQLGGMIPGARHGRVMGGGYTLVGENGPELLSGARGGLVLPASATRAKMRDQQGGGITIQNMTVIANDPIQFQQQMRSSAVMGARG